MMNDNLKGGNYSLITNPVKTKTGDILDAADTQTISYSKSMKQAAEELAKSGNPLEKAAANYYLFMDDPTRVGSAKFYENKLRKLGVDINAKSNTGNPAGDFAFDVVKGFVGSPAQTGRILAAGGMGATLLKKEKNKTKTLAGGAKNAFDATVQGAIDSPGQFVGGVLAGAAGSKGIGLISKAGSKKGKTTTAKTILDKQTKQTYNTEIIDGDINIGKNQNGFKGKTNGKDVPRVSVKKSGVKRSTQGLFMSDTLKLSGVSGEMANTHLVIIKQTTPKFTQKTPKTGKATKYTKKKSKWSKRKVNDQFIYPKKTRPTPDTFVDMGMDRGIIRMGKQRERQKQVVSKLGLDNSDMPYIIQRRSMALEKAGAAGRSVGGKAPIGKAPFTKAKTKTTSVITAAQARKPQNRSAAERARVRRVVDAQKKSGAYKSPLRKKRELRIIPVRENKALVTAEQARKPLNKSRKEQIRISRIVQAQRATGALPADIKIEVGYIRLPSGKSTRIEAKVEKIVSAKVNGKTRILTGKTKSQLKEEELIRRQRLIRAKPAESKPRSKARKNIRSLQNARQKQNSPKKQNHTVKRGKVKSATEQRIEANIRTKLSQELERGGIADTLIQAEMVLKNLPKAPQSERVRAKSTHAQRKNSGPSTTRKEAEDTGRKTEDGKTIFRDTDGTEYVEVDAGNGMVYKVRVKPQEKPTQTAVKPTSSKNKKNVLPKKTTTEKPQRKTTRKGSEKKVNKRPGLNHPSSNVKSTSKGARATLTERHRLANNTQRKTTTKTIQNKQTKQTHNTKIIDAEINIGKNQIELKGKTNPIVTKKNNSITQVKHGSPRTQRVSALKSGTVSSSNTHLSTRQKQTATSTKLRKTDIEKTLKPKQNSKSTTELSLALIPTVASSQKRQNVISGKQSKTGKLVQSTKQQPQIKPKPDTESKKESEQKIKQTPGVKISSQQKLKRASAFKETAQQITKSKQATKTTPKAKKKTKQPLRSKEEEKEKVRKKMKKIEQAAYRFETVNTFGWIKDSRPAAKPRRIK